MIIKHFFTSNSTIEIYSLCLKNIRPQHFASHLMKSIIFIQNILSIVFYRFSIFFLDNRHKKLCFLYLYAKLLYVLFIKKWRRNMDEIRNRIKEALSLRGMKQVELSEKTGISHQKINPWINQRWQPKQDSLYKMAKALDVSELWLAGYNVPMERPMEQKKMDQLAESILKIKANKRYTDIVTKLVMLDDDQLSIVENLLNQFTKE